MEQNERTQIAGELHRSVAQIFFAIGLEAEAALDEGGKESASSHLKNIARFASLGNQEIHNLMESLTRQPPNDSNLDLVNLLKKELKSFETRSKISTNLSVAPPEIQILQTLALAIQHLLMEYLFQVEKNGKINSVLINLKMVGDRVFLIVQDDREIDHLEKNKLSRFDLGKMESIIQEANGKVDITEDIEEGFCLKASFLV